MTFRTLAAAAVGAALSVAVLPAQATPYAGQFQYMSTGTVELRGADGNRWLMTLTATASGPVESRPEQRLYIDLSRCVVERCAVVGKWVRPLATAEVAITSATALIETQESTADLRTVVGGVPLAVHLDGDSVGGGAFDGLGSSTAPPGLAPTFSQYTTAGGKVTVAGTTCVLRPKSAEIGRVVTVDTIGDDVRDPRTAPPAHLPAGFVTSKTRLGCAR